MKKIIKTYVMAIVFISILILFNGLALSQETQQIPPEIQPQSQPQTVEPEAVESKTAEPETQWLWGEVVSVDKSSGQISVKYIDYETDSEKEIIIDTSTETIYENVAALEEIKPKDTLSIDYIITTDGKNLTKHISVEKLEAEPSEQLLPSESEVPQE